jgi:UDP-GlcNAc:undecaprenyl-phosphate/decaprenyl-phosphate GlcNAc-1-phosphate transferase
VSFPFNAYLLALAGAFAVSFASLPLWRAWCRRVGHVDDPGERKIHSESIPLAGGLAMLTGLLVPVAMGVIAIKSGFLGEAATDSLNYGLNKRAFQLGTILFGALAMTVLGWVDDKHELKAVQKFAGQVIIAGLVVAADIRITLFVQSDAFSFFVTILWMLTLINAFNFMDNMNGLCTGLGAIAAFFFALAAGVQGQYLVTTLALLTCGALLGFLPFNFPRASAFLGDAGSHLTGYLLAVLAILPHFYSEANPSRLAVLSPLLILAVPLLDLAWVVLLRTRLGRPFWIGDTNHLSHRLVRHGLSKTTAVLVIWLLAALGGAAAMLL